MALYGKIQGSNLIDGFRNRTVEGDAMFDNDSLHPKFVEAMRMLKAMSEEDRLSESNKELFEQAMNYAPLDIQPQLIEIKKKYQDLH